MLTSDLIQVRRSGNRIEPRYIDPDDPELQGLAEQLVSLMTESVGSPRFELDQQLKDLQGDGTEFLLHRALAKLLLDRCEFGTEAPGEPMDLRRAVFVKAARAWQRSDEDGAPIPFDADAVLAEAASSLETEPEILRRGLYADLKNEQVLLRFKEVTSDWLLRRYNVALAQGVLFKASALEIRLAPEGASRHRELFRKIKFFQLLHGVRRARDKSLVITLDGPLSLFKASQRYGLQMASFLPTLLHFDSWKLSADLLWGKQRSKKRFLLTSDDGLQPYSHLQGQWLPDELTWFPDRFNGLESHWSVSIEGALVPLGAQGILVPDFVFTHEDGLEVTMEVLGYWRKGAVESRLELLRKRGPKNLILAISKGLAGEPEALDDLPCDVYIFRSQPLPRQVLKLLEQQRAGA